MPNNDFLTKLESLMERATKGPFYVSLDDANDCPPHRNSGLSMIDTGRVSDWPFSRLCESHDAHLIAFLANHAPAIAKVVRETSELMRLYKKSVNVGPHNNPRTEAAICRRINDALAELSSEGKP